MPKTLNEDEIAKVLRDEEYPTPYDDERIEAWESVCEAFAGAFYPKGLEDQRYGDFMRKCNAW